MTKKDVEDVVNCVPDTIERILRVLQINLTTYTERSASRKLGSNDGSALDDQSTFAPNHHMGNKENRHNFNKGGMGASGQSAGANQALDVEILLEKEQTI